MSGRFGLAIIGGGPAGLAAARGYRLAGGQEPVAIVADEERMPYRRPPLTKELLRGELDEQELPLEAEHWLSEHGVALVGGHAAQLDPDDRTVMLSGGRRLAYRTCLLATGAEPVRLPVPGADDPGVRVLRSLDHFRELERRLGETPNVIVIGSGFIGCEIAASLAIRGHQVTLFADEPEPNADRLGAAAGEQLRGWLAEDGVTLHLGEPVELIERIGEQLFVRAGRIPEVAPVVVMAAGASPRGELAAAAGIELEDGAIPVDASLRARVPGVLGAGDVCKALNASAGRALRVEHWGDALAQGELAGRAAAGQPGEWDQVPGFWSTIGRRTLKYAAWGDGYDETRFERHGDGAFTVWYGLDGRYVGVLTHEADQSYERGSELIKAGARWN